jgi:NAD(P)-dependent dehydrogenase (short-subunit alcohol dehydrogenase family)
MADLSLFDLSGKKALVTGGASGIGRACALGMARAGADVAIIDVNVDMGRDTTREILDLGRKSIFVACDVTDLNQVQSMVRQVVEEFDRLDIAFNNAGIIVGSTKPTIGEESIDCWHKTMNLDLTAVFYCCREEAKYMIPQKYGKIINTASMSATVANNFPNFGAGFVAYCAAKAGVKHMSKALAMEWVQHNIYVNSISPGYIDTPMTKSVQENPELLNHENRTTPMHRQAKPEEMVGGVLYLASDASSFTTGIDLLMDGGHTVW